MHTRAASRAQKVNDLQKVNVFKKNCEKTIRICHFCSICSKVVRKGGEVLFSSTFGCPGISLYLYFVFKSPTVLTGSLEFQRWTPNSKLWLFVCRNSSWMHQIALVPKKRFLDFIGGGNSPGYWFFEGNHGDHWGQQIGKPSRINRTFCSNFGILVISRIWGVFCPKT